MSHSCVWPKGIIYGKPETLLEDVFGNSLLESLADDVVTGDCWTRS